MTVYTDATPHRRARLRRPTVYSAPVADPPPFPRPVILRSSCGHLLGVGIVGHRQRYLAWGRCS